jgi:hypothetical protein
MVSQGESLQIFDAMRVWAQNDIVQETQQEQRHWLDLGGNRG